MLIWSRVVLCSQRNNVSATSSVCIVDSDPTDITAFRPQPVRLAHSSDTPPEDDIPPPPASERKIARRRDSMHHVRTQQESTSPPTKRRRGELEGMRIELGVQASGSGSSASATASAAPNLPHIDFLNFSKSTRSRPSMPRPSSPPRISFASQSRSAELAIGGLDRKARKSLRGLGLGRVVDAVVPVPDRETPMIRKNKDMREQQRRSSLGMRGQRASDSLGRGDISE